MFRSFRIKKHLKEFARLLRLQDTVQALSYFERELSVFDADIPTAVRAAYHFHRWMQGRQDVHITELEALARNCDDDSQVVAAWSTAVRYRDLLQVADALRQNIDTIVPSFAESKAGHVGTSLLKLAECLILVRKIEHGVQHRQANADVGRRILAILPTAEDITEPTRLVRSYLFCHASFVVRQFDQISRDESALDWCQESARQEIAIAIRFAWGSDALAEGQTKSAMRALQSAGALPPPQHIGEMILQWGIRAITEQQFETAVDWFRSFSDGKRTTASPAWRRTMTVATAVAMFSAGRNAEATAVLSPLIRELKSLGAKRSAEANLCLSQASYLIALSALEESKIDVVSGESDLSLAERHRLLDRLHDRLMPSIQQLESMSPDVARQGHLVRGILAFVDNRTTTDEGELEQFSDAIRHLQSRATSKTRRRLQHIDARLRARQMVGRDAIAFIQSDDHQGLLDLKQNILSPMGPTAPPLLRAAVAIWLWNSDPRINPMLELREIASAASDNALLKQSFRLLRAANAIRQLSRECARAELSERIPASQKLAAEIAEIFDAPSATKFILARTIVQIRRRELALADETLAAFPDDERSAMVLSVQYAVAWRRGDLQTCQAIASDPVGAETLTDAAVLALRARRLLVALEDRDTTTTQSLIPELADEHPDSQQLSDRLVSLVVWLIEHNRAADAYDLLSCVNVEEAGQQAEQTESLRRLQWTCAVLQPIIAAAQMRFADCIENAERAIALPLPKDPVFGSAEDDRQMIEWLSVLSLCANVGSAATTADDLEKRLPSLLRNIDDKAATWNGNPAPATYVDLIHGLTLLITNDSRVHGSRISKLADAAAKLHLSGGTGAAERVIGRIRWRQRVLDQFWQSLKNGRFTETQSLYNTDVATVFDGEKPPALRLAMVLADWSTGHNETEELLDRLKRLQSDAPKFSTELVGQIRDYIRDGQKVRTLAAAIALLRNGRYLQARELLDQLASQLTELPGKDGERSELHTDMLGQCWYLSALSLLAGTETWATHRLHEGPGTDTQTDKRKDEGSDEIAAMLAAVPEISNTTDESEPAASDVESATARAAVDMVVRNRALWQSIRPELERLAARLSSLPSPHSGKGSLLQGLLAAIDNTVTLAPAQIERFSDAIEQLDTGAAQTRLRSVEGNLRARISATDETVELIRRNDVARLREFKQTVLDGLGNALPPMLRATTYVLLWRANPNYDAVADLQRIPAQPSEETLIHECIVQIRIATTLRRLAYLCRHPDRTTDALPSLTEVRNNAEMSRLATLASAIIQFTRGSSQAARASLPQSADNTDPDTVVCLRFHLAWWMGDFQECRQIVSDPKRVNRYLGDRKLLTSALAIRTLESSLEKNQTEESRRQLLELCNGTVSSDILAQRLPRIVVWLIERNKPQAARTLVSLVVRELAATEKHDSGVFEHVHWVCLFLNSLLSAQQEQFSACIDSVAQLLQAPVPAKTAFGPKTASQRLLNWSRLLRLMAELAVTATATDDLKARWRAVHRSLEQQTKQLEGQPELAPYVHLVTGLLSYISEDRVVDALTIDRLTSVQQVLPMPSRGQIVEGIIGRLNWRRQVIDQFWHNFKSVQFRNCRRMFEDELLPAFGAEIPATIRLAMVIVDQSFGEVGTAQLLPALARVDAEQPNLADITNRIRAYFIDVDKARRIVKLIRGNDFSGLVKSTTQTTWHGRAPNDPPEPVVIARVLGCYRTNQPDAGAEAAAIFSRRRATDHWSDYLHLLMGLFNIGGQNYQEAVESFERIQPGMILGHDIDRYWAIAHFSNGLKLLQVEQKDKSFEAFARSLGRRRSSTDQQDLAPLFIHFGLEGLAGRSGARARQAFELMEQSLEGRKMSADTIVDRLLAQTGVRLCDALMSEDVEDFGGDRFLELVTQLQSAIAEFEEKKGGVIPLNYVRSMESLFRKLAICQELRREIRRAGRARQKSTALYAFLREQLDKLKFLSASGDDPKQQEVNDPTLLAVSGVIDLRLRPRKFLIGPKADPTDALQSIETAIRMGASPGRLTALIEQYRENIRKNREKQGQVFELFDTYLASGAVPAEARDAFLQRNDMNELYRLNRNYEPRDFMTETSSNTVPNSNGRLSHLIKFIEDDDSLKKDDELTKLSKSLSKVLKSRDKYDEQVRQAEEAILARLAARVREDSRRLVGRNGDEEEEDEDTLLTFDDNELAPWSE